MLFNVFVGLLLVSTGHAERADSPQYYFGYGSNLSYPFFLERLKNGDWVDDSHKSGVLCGEQPSDLGCYVLPDYEFHYSLRGKSIAEYVTFGNVEESSGCATLGVLYRVSNEQLVALDKTENVPAAYRRIPLAVFPCSSEGLAGEPVTAWVYVGQSERVTSVEKPSRAYVERLLSGANDHDFPNWYLQKYLTFSQ